MNEHDTKATLIELAEKAGLSPEWVSATEGGEYHSSCPQCGGKDRFIIQPHRIARNGIIGCYFCRQCKINGSSYKFCTDFLKMKHKEIVQATQSSRQFQQTISSQLPIQDPLWIDSATKFSAACHKALIDDCSALKELEKTRGLKSKTILKHHLGISFFDLRTERESWGLSEQFNDKGHPRKLWIPEGLVIPYYQNDVVVKLKIRRLHWQESDKIGKYIIVSGSQSVCSLFGDPCLPIVIVEAELDAMLLWQEAGDICAVLAIGGASNFSDPAIQEILKKTRRILFALDFDTAGKAAFQRWRSTYPNLRAWPAPCAKSPGDAFLQRINLRTWISRGLIKYEEKQSSSQYDLTPPALIFPDNEEPTSQKTPVAPSLNPVRSTPLLPEQEIPNKAIANADRLSTPTPEKLAKKKTSELAQNAQTRFPENVSGTAQNPLLATIWVEYVSTQGGIKVALEKLLTSPHTFGIDIETYPLPKFVADKEAGLDPKKSGIRLVQIYDSQKHVYVFDIVKLGGIAALGEKLWLRPMTAHNAMFELKHLLHAGINPSRLGCTLLVDRVLNGNRLNLREELGLSKTAGLKDLAKELLGIVVSKELQTSDWSAPALTAEQIEYAALDAVLVAKIFPLQWELLQRQELCRAYQILRDAQHAVARMELTGIGFDVARHCERITAWDRESEALKQGIFETIGHELNLNSSKQLDAWLREALAQKDLEDWAKTEKGQLSTSTHAFKLHEHIHDILPMLVEYRHLAKRFSSFGKGLYKYIDAEAGRLYGRFSLGMTTTGRMSSNKPNMQNMPRNAFRDLFCAAEGYNLIGLDYSQQELRIAALITGDKELQRIYAEGGDVHVNTAAAILKIPPKEVTKEQRQLGKAVIFGLLFGQGAPGLAVYAERQYGVSMTVEEASQHKTNFCQTYKGLRSWQYNTGNKAKSTQKICTPCGRIRDFSKEKAGYSYTAALNLPIQGAAAEITLRALTRLTKLLSDDCRLVNVIHDEILLEVRQEHVDEFAETAKEAMRQAFLDVFPDAEPYLKGLVEAKIGKNWAETK